MKGVQKAHTTQYNWLQPEGAERIGDCRTSCSLMVSGASASGTPLPPPVQSILLALSTLSQTIAALPRIQWTLPQGELFHRAIVGRVGKGRAVDCPELTGRDRRGQPLDQGHQHAHVLPLDLDGDNHIDHVLVYAAMGLGDAAQRAIRSLKRTWTKGGVGDLQVSVVGRGDLDALRQLPEPFSQAIQRLLGPQEGSQIWISETPFVPPRFVKRRGRNTIEGQIQSELASRNLSPAVCTEVLSDSSIRLRDFIRVRHHGGTPPPRDVGYAMRIELSEPIHGPLTLGYASHFGLGRFAAEIAD